MTDDDFSLDDDLRDDTAGESHGMRNFLAGVVLGALVGAGVALLYAPDRGTTTRRRLGRKLRRFRDRSGESVQDLKDALRQELRRVKRA